MAYSDDPVSTSKVAVKFAKENENFKILGGVMGNKELSVEDIKTYGMSIVTCTDCWDGVPNDSMWQYLDNAEQLVIDKYGSGSDKLTALREDRYIRAMEAKTPYESMKVAGPIIDATSQEIKNKNRHLPMRR